MTLPRIAICLLALLCGSCASGPNACRRDPITGQQNCVPASGSYVEAATTVAVAAAAWSAVGCTVNGCEPPFTCNGKTKLCERIRCSEGQGACPPAYVCDPVDQVCK